MLFFPIQHPTYLVDSGHGYSGNDGFSGTKPLDDAILFTNSGITALTELFWGKF